MTGKVSILIDRSNVYFKLKDLKYHKQTRLDFSQLLELLAGKYKISESIYYIEAVRTDGTLKSQKLHARQQKLFAHLKKHQLKYKLGYLLNTNGKKHEKGVDVQIAVDLLVNAYENKTDKVCLISSDTNLIPAIKKAQLQGLTVEYIGFKHKFSNAMYSICDSVTLLAEKDIRSFVLILGLKS